ncbi:polysaccharide deacetylase family protein [Pontibacter pamirensis]|uniref:polysaccharide deacetylase family protein n=1 Tax=Pontibacter pamirensis TaxID=2562824 RepID=UPI001389CA38|nr:polysaccharide deacetylase family protein [Pontibacter pamirensis]
MRLNKEAIRNSLYGTLNVLQPLFRRFYKRDNLRVLAYHTIPDPAAFEKQLVYLKRHYNLISVYDLIDHMEKGKKLPDRPLLITFDDGDMSMYTHGLPLFKKYKVPALLFIITGLIGTDTPFWWNTVQEYYGSRGEANISLAKKNELKRIPNKERLAALDKMQEHIPGFRQEQLSRKQLEELSGHHITMGNHSHTHPMFDQLTDEEWEKEFELTEAFFKMENLPGYQWFAYPNGNYDATREHILKEHQIKAAFLFDHHINDASISPLRISRIKVNTYDPLAEFKVKVSGLHGYISRTRS